VSWLGEEVLKNLPVQSYWTNITRRVPFEGGFSDFVADRRQLDDIYR
jgi:hypothetical protein